MIVTHQTTPTTPGPTGLTLTSPLDYQVVQRKDEAHGRIMIRGRIGAGLQAESLEARLSSTVRGDWQPLGAVDEDGTFSVQVEAPAGGWYRLDVRALDEGRETIGTTVVEHVGVGEVFVVAGQSNCANHGEVLQCTTTRRVSSFDGSTWRLADDPQPGASGAGGSFMPPFGDGLVRHFGVPIGFAACGQGGTSVREWLPAGTTFANPPTVDSRVRRTSDGLWESKGDIYASFVESLRQLGPRSFRAVLWHQGESDANQADPSRTLTGDLYRSYLSRLICDSRRDIGWAPPWFVAQVSYHGPGDEADPDIRAAQASLWEDGTALRGPDTDLLKGAFREADGAGVHFSGPGLHALAASWLERVAPWLQGELAKRPTHASSMPSGS